MNVLAPSPRCGRPTLDDGLALATAAAAEAAYDVDRAGRFPSEAFAAIRSAGLLGAMVPAALGGGGASLRETCRMSASLASGCGSTGLVFAMHQIQVACLLGSAAEPGWPREFLRELARHEMLLASVTSEIGIGGDVRRSLASVELDGAGFVLRKRSPSISYGAHADALLVTARRGPDAAAADQVLVVAPPGSFTLVRGARWDTLGMRGTCSDAFDVEMSGDPRQILPVPFGEICEAAMLPSSHLLWGAVWTGIAAAALERARLGLRKAARATQGALPPGASRFGTANSLLMTMRARLRDALDRHEADAIGGLRGAVELNSLKIALSETANEIVRHAMLIGGIESYRNDTESSLSRHVRDLQSAPLMINNDRLAANASALAFVQPPDPLVF